MQFELRDKKQKIRKRVTKKSELIVGTVQKNRKGFGFLIPEKDENGDVFIAARNLKGAMNGDTVAVRLFTEEETDRTREGAVEEILQHGVTEVVGTFEKSKRFGFVVPDDKRQTDDVFILKKDFNGAKKGDKVVASITKWPDENDNAEGRITEIVSRSGEPGGDIKALIRQYNLTKDFPEKVRAQTGRIKEEISQEEMEGRRDLRNKTTITIDGADSKDFDDAVSVEKLENGNYLLGVHIADVSHYVREGAPLDKEALKRGNSVYLIDQVIPMLPEALSNGICSLNPHEDRLTLTASMEIDCKGKVLSHEIYESVIHSKERMIYTDVSDMIENNAVDLISKYTEIYQDILMMAELAGILQRRREARGSLDFDFDEARITLNSQGIPTSIETAERRAANRMIEEFMLVANETVAEHFYWMEVPFVYRIHENPDPDKIDAFKKFLAGFGLYLHGSSENLHPKALNEILNVVEGKAEEHVVNTVMLRSMKKAFYGTDCQGHFGLGVKYYCHFTSPIRRYPDLMIHRIIKESLHGKLDEKRLRALKKKTSTAADNSSVTERQAQELEREVEKLKKAEFMSYHIGETHEGIISGAASFGFFVEIENTVEGMVKVDHLNDDYYDYEAEKYRLKGRRTNRIFALGDKVTVKVHSVDIQNREINFTVAKAEGTGKKVE